MISEAAKQEINDWIAKYPASCKQSAVMAALAVVQRENGGWLDQQRMDAVADYLEMPRIAVYEVATFYSMYDLKPVGRHKIGVCTNISCLLRGSDKIVEHLQKRLNVKCGQTSADGRFTLKEVECLAACGGAPMMQIDQTYYENLTPEKVDEILERLQSAC